MTRYDLIQLYGSEEALIAAEKRTAEIFARYERERKNKSVNEIACEINLKPCPFCGGKAEIIRSYNRDCLEFGGTVKIGCRCGIYTSEVVFRDESDLQKVFDKWNRRANNDT